MRILHWNCQGLGNLLTIHILEDIRKYHKPNIMFLIETMHDVDYVQGISKRLNYAHSFVLPSNGLSGGLGIFLDDEVTCDIVGSPSTYYTNVYVSDGTDGFWLSYAYGHPRRQRRSRQWKRMISMVEAGMYGGKPRLVLGDLNDISNNEEKQGGTI